MASHTPASRSLAGVILDINIHQGRNLVAKDRNLLGKRTTSDPFVRVYIENRDSKYSHMDLKQKEERGLARRIGKTSIKPKTLNPTWNKNLHVELDSQESLPIIQQKLYATFLIFDHDNFSSDDPMGTVSVCLYNTRNDTTNDNNNWYPVQKGIGRYHCNNSSGELQLSVAVQAKKVLSLVRGNAHPLFQHRNIRVGLAWDMEDGQNIDLDASCVAVDKKGNLMTDETVYYGNLSNPNGSISHSGDERTGETVGDDEVIRCQLNRIPSNVMALYFLLTVATPGRTLNQIKSAYVSFKDTETMQPICNFTPASIADPYKKCTAMFLVRLARDREDGSNWRLCPIEDVDENARDFGALIPKIKSYTRDLVPNIKIDPQERIAVMRKAGVIRVQDYVKDQQIPEWVTFGLAWDVTKGKKIDLDASAICYDKDLNTIETIYFNNLKSKNGAIAHSGDERSGAASGDDEKINFSLGSIDPKVAYIAIVVTSYSGQELDDVSHASCHLYDPKTNKDIATYALSNSRELDKHTALTMGCLFRGNNGEWLLRIISEPGEGKTPNKLFWTIKKYLSEFPPPPPTIPSNEPEFDISMPQYVPHNEAELYVTPISVYDYYHQQQQQQPQKGVAYNTQPIQVPAALPMIVSPVTVTPSPIQI